MYAEFRDIILRTNEFDWDLAYPRNLSHASEERNPNKFLTPLCFWAFIGASYFTAFSSQLGVEEEAWEDLRGEIDWMRWNLGDVNTAVIAEDPQKAVPGGLGPTPEDAEVEQRVLAVEVRDFKKVVRNNVATVTDWEPKLANVNSIDQLISSTETELESVSL